MKCREFIDSLSLCIGLVTHKFHSARQFLNAVCIAIAGVVVAFLEIGLVIFYEVGFEVKNGL